MPTHALETFAAGVTGVEVVPELDVVFVELPTEENFVTVTQVRKIDEATVEVFDDDAHVLHATELGVEFGQGGQHAINGRAAEIARSIGLQLREFLVGLLELFAMLVGGGEELAEQGQHCTGFGQREMFREFVHAGLRRFRAVVFDGFLGGVPRQGGAFDTDGEFEGAFEGFEVAEFAAAEGSFAAHHLEKLGDERAGFGWGFAD